MASKVIDWTAMRTEFASGNLSLTAFAGAKKLALSAVKKHAQAEGWEAARSTFRAKVAEQKTEKVAAFRARSEAEIDNRVHVVTDTATEIIKGRLERIKAGKEKASALDIKLLTDALKANYETQRLTAGLPKQKVPDKVQVEGALELATGVVELPTLKDE